jgi:hypothetical protein
VFGFPPTDAKAKRKHLDWMNSYVNLVLLNEGWPENERGGAASVIKGFHLRNDSALSGSLKVSS